MFKNDIKINYGAIHTLIYRLNRYKTALEDMKTAIHSIESIFNKGKGEAMETFGIKSEELIKKIDGVEKEISDISGILQRYVTDMTAIIKPVNMDKMMRVDRNDIYWNMQTINGTCMGIPMIPMNVGVSSFGDWFDWDEDEEERDRRRRNDDKLDEIKRMFRNTAKQVSDMADNLNRLYKKVQNYEDMDDKYEKEAKKLKKEYTSFWEGVGDVINEVADIVVSFGKGLFDGIKDFLVGLVELVGGILKYVGSAAVCLYGEVSGKDVPNWAEECYNETNETVLGVLKDPTILVEGLAQGISDSFEEKGGAYCGGYVVGTVASAIAGSKGMDKLRGLGKGAGAAGKAEKVVAAEGAVETSETAQKIAGTIERVEALEGAEGVGEALSGIDDVARAGKTVKASPILDEIQSKGGKNLELSRIEYLRSKYGKLTSEQLNARINLRQATHDKLHELIEAELKNGMSKKKIQNKIGPAVAGVYDPVTGKYHFGINNLNGDLPENLHKLLRANYDNMPAEGIFVEYNKFTYGAGSHAEIYALNEALLERELMGIPVKSLDELTLTVIKGPKCGWNNMGMPMPRCPHCEYITGNVKYFPEVLKYEKELVR